MTDPNENLEQLFNSIIKLQPDEQSKEIFRNLISLTLEFRDKKKAESGIIVTVEDVHQALTALENHNNNEKHPNHLTDLQNELAKILIDYIILYKYKQ